MALSETSPIPAKTSWGVDKSQPGPFQTRAAADLRQWLLYRVAAIPLHPTPLAADLSPGMTANPPRYVSETFWSPKPGGSGIWKCAASHSGYASAVTHALCIYRCPIPDGNRSESFLVGRLKCQTRNTSALT
ncbi:hypothetical protein DSO57_1027667 [Entomophthora muscae]|uniref:Uncharacterized protein n=1 Tax=Entomophthora muscae TaxID=34485 RepID=A0ACC2UM86_9FUNG|nr:hypothetical protein DSO57_1027667 [Entomophthora muscae]